MKRDYAEEALWMAEDAFAANFHSYVAGISPYEPDGYCLLWYRGQARAAARLRDMQFRLERVLPERCRVCGQWFSPGVTSIVRCASCRTQHVRGKP